MEFIQLNYSISILKEVQQWKSLICDKLWQILIPSLKSTTVNNCCGRNVLPFLEITVVDRLITDEKEFSRAKLFYNNIEKSTICNTINLCQIIKNPVSVFEIYNSQKWQGRNVLSYFKNIFKDIEWLHLKKIYLKLSNSVLILNEVGHKVLLFFVNINRYWYGW